MDQQPPLTVIPEGEWFCPECDEVGNTTALQDYLENHYTDRLAHRGSKHMKWLQNMHKSLTDDVRLPMCCFLARVARLTAPLAVRVAANPRPAQEYGAIS